MKQISFCFIFMEFYTLQYVKRAIDVTFQAIKYTNLFTRKNTGNSWDTKLTYPKVHKVHQNSPGLTRMVPEISFSSRGIHREIPESSSADLPGYCDELPWKFLPGLKKTSPVFYR